MPGLVPSCQPRIPPPLPSYQPRPLPGPRMSVAMFDHAGFWAARRGELEHEATLLDDLYTEFEQREHAYIAALGEKNQKIAELQAATSKELPASPTPTAIPAAADAGEALEELKQRLAEVEHEGEVKLQKSLVFYIDRLRAKGEALEAAQ
eukprot:6160703-Prymnesium_polylepis.1